MNRDEFILIRTLCQESTCCQESEMVSEEFPNIRDRILEGENIIDLYMDLKGYIYEMGWRGDEEKVKEQENEFWAQAEQYLIEA